MRREPSGDSVSAGKVVHVVGRVTDEVFSFLGPATNALAQSGLKQAVVMIDELRYRRHAAALHESVELVLTPGQRSWLGQWRAVLHACKLQFQKSPLEAVHLHGLLPCLVGALAMRSLDVKYPVFYSPHGSRSLGQWKAIGRLLLPVAKLLLGGTRRAVIVNVQHESYALEAWDATTVVESPISDVFFNESRHEARNPLIVTRGRSQDLRAVELFSQLAVLWGGNDLRIGFNWIGSVDPVSKSCLSAAGVGIADLSQDSDCASRLAEGWIYLAPTSSRGFPLSLAEAMSAGIPCVAVDVPQHRELIVSERTGYLYQTEQEMMSQIAMLVDDETLRKTIGMAAREAAIDRFRSADFDGRLLAAYAKRSR